MIRSSTFAPPPLVGLLLAVLLTLSSFWTLRSADAAEPEPEAPAARPAEPAAPVVTRADEARGYSEGPGIEPEDVPLFVPRAIFFLPARFLGMVTTPIREAMRFVEKHHVVERVEDFLYNDERTAAVLPVITVSTFLGAQIGVRAFHDNLGGHGESLSGKVSLGVDWDQLYMVTFEAKRIRGTPVWVEAKTVYEDHPSLRFYGLGGDADEMEGGSDLDPRGASVKSFYSQRRFRQLGTLGATLGRPGLEAQIGARGRFKAHEFDLARGLKPLERNLQNVYDTSQVVGYDDGAVLAEAEAVGVVDIRDPKQVSGHAFHAEVFGGGALPLGDYYYGHFGAEITGYIDLYHGDRILVLRAVFESVDGDLSRVPFVELPSLGGPHRLRGYPLFRFRDKKAMVGTVEYQYPIHQMIAGTFFVDVGQVSPSYGELVTNPGFKVGGGGGLVVRSKKKVTLSLEVAGGEGVQVIFTTDPLRAFSDREDEL